MLVEPEQSFRDLSEPAVREALADPNPKNPVAAEVARLMAGYGQNFTAHVARLGYMPADVWQIWPRFLIEAVAIELATETICEELERSR